MQLSRTWRQVFLVCGLITAALIVYVVLCAIGTFLIWWFVAGAAMEADIVAPGVLSHA